MKTITDLTPEEQARYELQRKAIIDYCREFGFTLVLLTDDRFKSYEYPYIAEQSEWFWHERPHFAVYEGELDGSTLCPGWDQRTAEALAEQYSECGLATPEPLYTLATTPPPPNQAMMPFGAVTFTPEQTREIEAMWTKSNPFYELIKLGKVRFAT